METPDPVRPAVLALSGRRIDAPGTARARFPRDAVPRVRAELAARLHPGAAHALVCSAACGADLLALEVAGRAGVPRHVILPFEPAIFRRTSVVDRPGGWGALFDAVIREVAAAGTLSVGGACADDPDAYARANADILARASALAGDGADAPGRAALVVWDGAPRGLGDATAHFRDAARRAGFVLLPPVLTLAAPRHRA